MFQVFKLYFLLKLKIIDIEEYNFIQYLTKKKNIFNKRRSNLKKLNTIVCMSPDYFHLAQTAYLLRTKKFENQQIIGIWSNIYSKYDNNNFLYEQIIYLKKILLNFFLRLKWITLYKSIGVTKIINLRNFELLGIDFLFTNKNKLKKLSYKKLKKIKIDRMPMYENIIDTFIRFRNKPTVDYNDYYLKEIIIKLENLRDKFIKNFSKLKKSTLILNYSNYHLGIIAKTALSLNFDVYATRDASSYLKKLSKDDYTTNMQCINFKKKFKKIKNKKFCLEKARNELKKKFSGKREVALYQLSKSSYANSKKKMPNKYDGVLFLHNFFDTPNHIKSLMFEDFYDWSDFTLNIINEYNLNIAVKPHPTNEIYYGSKELIEKLKEKYPKVKWIDPQISNKEIIKKIKFGISCYGSILYELPYVGLVSIAGTSLHPSNEYNIVHTPKSKSEYKKLIINSSSLNKKKNLKASVEEFYYMFCLHNHDALKNTGRDLDLKSINFNSSKGLNDLIDKIKNIKCNG